jgi:hypothetical protein
MARREPDETQTIGALDKCVTYAIIIQILDNSATKQTVNSSNHLNHPRKWSNNVRAKC